MRLYQAFPTFSHSIFTQLFRTLRGPAAPRRDNTYTRPLFAFAFTCCISRAMAAMAGKKTAPVDKLMHVTAYPKAKATRTATTLSELVPAGTPLVIHLYTG